MLNSIIELMVQISILLDPVVIVEFREDASAVACPKGRKMEYDDHTPTKGIQNKQKLPLYLLGHGIVE